MFNLTWNTFKRECKFKSYLSGRKELATLPIYQAIEYLKRKIISKEKKNDCDKCQLRCVCPLLFKNNEVNNFTIKVLNKQASNTTDINNTCMNSYSNALYTSNGIDVFYRHQKFLNDWEKQGIFLTRGSIVKGDFITCFPGTIYRIPYDLEYTFVEESGILHLPEWLTNNHRLLRLYDSVRGCYLLIDGHSKGESAINFLSSLRLDRCSLNKQLNRMFQFYLNPECINSESQSIEHIINNSPLLNWLDLESFYTRSESQLFLFTNPLEERSSRSLKSELWKKAGHYIDGWNDYGFNLFSELNMFPPFALVHYDSEERDCLDISPGVGSFEILNTANLFGVYEKNKKTVLRNDLRIIFHASKRNKNLKTFFTQNKNYWRKESKYHSNITDYGSLIDHNQLKHELLIQSTLAKQMSLGSYINYTDDKSIVNVEFHLIHLPLILPCYLQDYVPNVRYQKKTKGSLLEVNTGNYCIAVVAKCDIGLSPNGSRGTPHIKQKRPIELLAHKKYFGIGSM